MYILPGRKHTYKIRVRRRWLLLGNRGGSSFKKRAGSRSTPPPRPYLFHATSGNVGDVAQGADLGLSSKLHLLVFDLHVSAA